MNVKSCLASCEQFIAAMFLLLWPALAQSADVLTYHNSTFSDGQNLNETVLTPANVGITTFGKLFSVPLNAKAITQPLFKSGLNITTGPQQGVQDVVFVTTLNNTLYAINAVNGTVLWQTSLLHAFHGGTPTPNPKGGNGGWGILATPAIDLSTNAIYVESSQIESGNNQFMLSAINLANGTYYANPLIIAESDAANNYVSGPAVNKIGGGQTRFVTQNMVCRTLKLSPVNHVVYMGFSNPTDGGEYHGFVIGYSAVKDGSSNLPLKAVFCTSPQSGQCGVWGAGGAITVDASGNLFISTGNGPFQTSLITAPWNGRLSTNIANLQVPSLGEYGNSVLKLAPDSDTSQQADNPNGYGLHVNDYFTPKNALWLNIPDWDLGASGPTLLPDSVGNSTHQQLLVQNSKAGGIYLIDRNNMGGYHGNAAADGTSGTNNCVQELPGATEGAKCNAAFFAAGSATSGTIYYATSASDSGGVPDVAKAFSITNAHMNPTPTSTSANSYGTYRYPGATASISANGGSNGIVWTLDRLPDVLVAYDASNLNTVLFRSDQGTGNAVGDLGIFALPTIANGRVYVPGIPLTVYGITGNPPVITSSLIAAGTVGSAFSYQITAGNSPASYNATGLPAGLSVNTSTGVISGTPSTAATTNVIISATNGLGTGTATLVLTVNASGGSGGTFANASFETPSIPTYSYNPAGSSWTFTNNAGIQHNGSGFGTTAPDGVQTSFLQGINGTLGTMSQSVNFATTGTNTIKFQAARRPGNAVQPILVSVDGITVGTYTPAGDSYALITTAAYSFTAGNHTIKFAATDSSGDKTSFIDLVSIGGGGGGGGAPSITSLLTATGTVGSAFSYQITATNSPTSYSATGLPAGLSVNTGTGVISGTPSAAATSNVTISATNGSGTGTATLVLTVNPSGGGAPSITSSLTATGTVGSTFSYQITASNSPTSYNATSLPAGLSVNTGTGVISGTPSSAATSNVTLSATNGSGTGTATLVLTVNPSGGGSATFANNSFETPSTGNYIYNPGGSSWTWTNNGGIQHNGSAYAATNAPDGTQTALVQGVGGTLGTMSQSVNFTTAGSYTISFQGARRSSQIQPIRITVDGTTVGTYTPASNSFALITTAAFSVTAGNHTIMFAATDNSGDKTSFIDLVSIGSGGGGAAPSITSSLTATGTVGSAFSYQITASNSPTSYNATGLPAGLSVNTSTGVISGTPSVAATTNVSLGATNGSGTGTATLVLTVNPSGGGGSATFANAGFETPFTGNYIYNPGGSNWTWTNNAGIQHNGSAYAATNAPEGTQTALVQGVGGTLGTMSQSVNFTTAGSYTISFQAAMRSGVAQPIRVSVDGTTVGTYTPASNNFGLITTAAFSVTAGNHTVMFAATDNSGDKTIFIDLLSISSAGGGGAPAAPTNLTATAGNAQISLSWTASSGATSYEVYRGTTSNGESTTAFATGITTTSYTNSGLTNGTTYYYKVKAVNASGSSAYSNEAFATPSSGASATFANASFETPAVGSYSYNPVGSSWTFTNNAGIQHNGSAYSGTTAIAPDGTQTAFVQGINSTLGTMSQSVNFSAGTYMIRFQAARRTGNIQPVRVSVDGTTVGTYTPASDSFALITTAPFTVTAGSHTIQFAATDNVGDKTSFIDLVSIQ